jgi:hypothetical protein
VGNDGEKVMGCKFCQSFILRRSLRIVPDQRWNYEFIKLLSQVMTTTITSRPPPYAAILDLDRKLRDFDVPAHLKLQWTGQMSSDSLFWIRRWVVLSNKEWSK